MTDAVGCDPEAVQLHELHAQGRRISASTWGSIDAAKPAVVLMHGGLDCTTTWKGLPEVIAASTGLAVLAYDRYGYGRSDRLLPGRAADYRREEAGPVLGDVLRHFGVCRAVLFGHSDGGAMALLAAAAHPETVRGVLVCAPTVAFDEQTARAMARAREAFVGGDLRTRLLRHHGDNTDSMFWAWHDQWANADTLRWSMHDEIAALRCPVSTLFGADDDYGWRPSAKALVQHGMTALEILVMPGAGHHPQHRARPATLEMLARLIARLN